MKATQDYKRGKEEQESWRGNSHHESRFHDEAWSGEYEKGALSASHPFHTSHVVCGKWPGMRAVTQIDNQEGMMGKAKNGRDGTE
jgi:hypothetical protein